jgi:hypothetical protein
LPICMALFCGPAKLGKGEFIILIDALTSCVHRSESMPRRRIVDICYAKEQTKS